MDVTVTGVPKPTDPTILSPFFHFCPRVCPASFLRETEAQTWVAHCFPRWNFPTLCPSPDELPPLYPALSPHFPYGTAGVCHDSQEFLTVPKLTLLGWDRKAGCS